jgi:hypothetical protein
VDVDEAAGELTVVVDQPVTNPENIHATSCSAPQTFRWLSMPRRKAQRLPTVSTRSSTR